MPAALQTPPPMQPSPPRLLAPGPSRSFGADLCMTNIPVSDLKRPAESMPTEHVEQQNFEPVTKKIKRSVPDASPATVSGAATFPSKASDKNDDGNNSDDDDLNGDLFGGDVFCGFGCSSPKHSPTTRSQDNNNNNNNNHGASKGLSGERHDEIGSRYAPTTHTREDSNNHDESSQSRSGERHDENGSCLSIGVADGAATFHDGTCDPHELAFVGNLSHEDSLRSFLEQFPPVPAHKPEPGEAGLDSQLETIACPTKRNAISTFLKEPNHSKKYSTKPEYDLRKRECLTLGRMLIGRYCGVSGGTAHENKWYRHPVHAFRMWLRIDKNGKETLWTCRNNQWKRNVCKELFPVAAYGIYHRLWQDKVFWEENGKKGNPRTNKDAFRQVAFSMLSVGFGEGLFNQCLDEFWKSPQREALQQKYADALSETVKSQSKKKSNTEQQEQFSMQEQQLLLLNRDTLAGTTVNVASGATYVASGATGTYVGSGGVVNNHYHVPTGHSVPRAAPSNEPATRSV